MRHPGLVGQELFAMLGAVIDDLHADQELDLRVAPGLSGFAVHQPEDVVLIVDDPVEPLAQMTGPGLRP
jgi:hypothetical protein